MAYRLVLPAVLGAILLSTPVLAANSTASKGTGGSGPSVHIAASIPTSAKCAALEQQFDEAILSHESAAKATEAKALRAEGGRLCAGHNDEEGINKLGMALYDIGLKPKYWY